MRASGQIRRNAIDSTNIGFQGDTMGKECAVTGSSTAIDSSNIGFQLLKKHGWKEGSGLGLSEQGRLEPVQVHLKNNKRGLGANKAKKKKTTPPRASSDETTDTKQISSKKSKTVSKRMRKMQELEKQLQEKEFERAFFRDFWPDNV